MLTDFYLISGYSFIIITLIPLSFEYNVKFLVDLAFHSYTCYFGTFLADSVFFC